MYRLHGQLELALEYQQRALAMHEKAGVPFTLMQSLNAVGVTYQALGREREARPYLERALALARASGNQRAVDFVAANFVTTLMAEGAFEEVVRLLQSVLERNLDVYPLLRWRDLSMALFKLGRLDAALDAINRALERCSDNREMNCVYALDTRAGIHLARDNRAAAVVDLERAVDLIEQARAKLVPADFFKQQFGRSQTALFSRTIDMQLSEGRPREALETAERARARAFLDLLASQDLASGRGDDTGGAEQAMERRSELAAPPPTAADLAAAAARLQSTLIVYWVSWDRLYIWTVQPNGAVHATSVPVSESRLADLVAATAPLPAGAPRRRADGSPWQSLYDLVIRPIRGALPQTPGALVTIVPHGPLAMLTFAALQDDRSRYLIEDYTLHYVPAAAILQFTAARRERATRPGETLIVADPVLPRRSALERPLLSLPGARAEARAITRGAPATVLEGRTASETMVRNSVGGKGILHFATHAIVDDAAPFSSYLALAGTAGGAAHDGTLTAQEIYGLQLQADLVMLSACRSGGGRVTGDGLSTFARAFIYAGTPSLITSVWDVADESTSHLVPEFYREWRRGASKAQALRAAQLSFLRKLRSGTLMVETAAGPMVLPQHPALWAGFMLIGEP
jgi:CHAT domain-containing protein